MYIIILYISEVNIDIDYSYKEHYNYIYTVTCIKPVGGTKINMNTLLKSSTENSQANFVRIDMHCHIQVYYPTSMHGI